MSLTHTGDTKQLSLLRTREGAKPSPRTLTKTLPEVNQSMNEEEAEEQANFLKGLCKALDGLASDLDRTKNRVEIIAASLEGLKQGTKNIRGDIEAYFNITDK